MTSYRDLARCDYFGYDHQLIAVGWLERGDHFARGEVDARAFSRLRELLIDPFQPVASGGLHECSLCRFTPEARGTRNLFVPNGLDLFVAPELIVHYVNAHGYAPPSAFRLPPSAFRLPPSAFSLPRNAFRLPPSAFRLPPSAFRLPPSAVRLPPSAFRLPPSAFRLLGRRPCLP
jgi:hypothetical protein